MLILLTELDRAVRSPGTFDHIGFDTLLGESNTVLLPRLLRWGILIPLPVIGDASGEDSANVE